MKTLTLIETAEELLEFAKAGGPLHGHVELDCSDGMVRLDEHGLGAGYRICPIRWADCVNLLMRRWFMPVCAEPEIPAEVAHAAGG